MKSIFELHSFDDILANAIPKLRSRQATRRTQKCDLQIRTTRDGHGTSYLDFRVREDLIARGVYLSVTVTKECLLVIFSNKDNECARPLTRESKEGYFTGSYKARFSKTATNDYSAIVKRYAHKDYNFVSTLFSDKGVYAIEPTDVI